MNWWYICIDRDGRTVSNRPSTQESVEAVIPTLLATGRWRDPSWRPGAEIVLADWRWSNRWKRFTIHDTGGGTHIIKQVPE